MTLHEDKALFKEAIEATAQHFRLRLVFIEKDYWVTYVLRNLALSKFIDTVIFKGGTSLSKAYQCIDRFSEDIDLAILSPGNYTRRDYPISKRSYSRSWIRIADLLVRMALR